MYELFIYLKTIPLFQYEINEPQRQKADFRHYAPSENSGQLTLRAVWSESSLEIFWIAEDAKFLYADN